MLISLNCFTGDTEPTEGSGLVKDAGFEYSLASLLIGRLWLTAELVAEGGPSRQNCVMPSIG